VPDTLQHYNVTFYQSPAGLPAGNHTLQMVLVQSETIWIDSMNITKDSQSPATPGASTTSLVEGAVTPTLLPASTAASSSNAVSRVAVIASGVLPGGVLFLLLLSLAFWYIYRRFTTTQRTGKGVSQAEGPVLIPFYDTSVSGSVAGSSMNRRDKSLAGTGGSHLGTVMGRPTQVEYHATRASMPPPPTGVPPEYSEYSVSG
jgi:hypothetical protein